MKIIINELDKTLTVIREDGDPKFRNGGWGCGESRLMYHIKQKLIKMGFDVIKKRMWKDGHLTSMEKQYIRTRNLKKGFYILDNLYDIRNSADVFNNVGKIEFLIETFGGYSFPPKKQ